MADLLTHVLVAYVLFTLVDWRYDLGKAWVSLGMAGTVLPDLVKIDLFVPGTAVEAAIGLEYGWGHLATVGGVALTAGAVAIFVVENRARAYVVLLGGGLSGLVVDGLRAFADGDSGTWLYPLIWWEPPTPGLYVSSDPAVLGVALVVAGVVYAADHRLVDRSADRE